MGVEDVSLAVPFAMIGAAIAVILLLCVMR